MVLVYTNSDIYLLQFNEIFPYNPNQKFNPLFYFL